MQLRTVDLEHPRPRPSPNPNQVSTVDLEHVLYGNRNADLLDFLHGDLPKQARKTTPVKVSKPKAKQSKLNTAGAAGAKEAEADEAEEDEEGEEPPAGKENAGKRRKGGKAAAANAEVQSTNMHSFFSKGAAVQEQQQGGSGQRKGVKRAMQGEMEDEVDMDDELLEDEGGEGAGAAAAAPAHGRKRRLALVSDDDSDGE